MIATRQFYRRWSMVFAVLSACACMGGLVMLILLTDRVGLVLFPMALFWFIRAIQSAIYSLEGKPRP